MQEEKSEITETTAAILRLAERLESGEVKFVDVLLASEKSLRPVTGVEVFSEDPDQMAAIEVFSQALAKAFHRQQIEILTDTLFGIGHGVAIGLHGAPFFDRITRDE